MAISIVSTPNIADPNGYAASTSQLRYVMTTDQAAQSKYRLSVYISEIDLQLYFLPNPSNELIFDVGAAVEQVMFRDANTYIYYRLTLAEEWEGSSEASTFSDYTLAIVSKRQILSSNGSNMFDYVLQTGLGKFLSVFQYPRIWEGYSSKASIINLTETAVKLIETTLNINKATISATTTSKTITTNTIQKDDLSHESPPSYFLQVQYTDNADVPISEQKIFKLEPACRNSMMIEWVNSLGGVDRWLFMYEQAVTNIAGEGLSYSTPITESIATATGNKFRAAGEDTQYLILKADQLTADDLRGLHDIKRSDQVRLLLPGQSTSDPEEITTNSEFTTDLTGWANVDHPTLGAGGAAWSWSSSDGGRANAAAAGLFSQGLQQALTIQKGRSYRIETDITHCQSNSQDTNIWFEDDSSNRQLVFSTTLGNTVSEIVSETIVADANYTKLIIASSKASGTTCTQCRYLRLFEFTQSYVNVVVNALYQTDYTTGKQGYEFSLSVELPNDFDYFKA